MHKIELCILPIVIAILATVSVIKGPNPYTWFFLSEKLSISPGTTKPINEAIARMSGWFSPAM